MTTLDPIIDAIVAADMATVVHTATLVHLDEDDEEQMARSNAAAHAASEAFDAVREITPATLAGLHTLVKFYARDAKIYERWSSGGDYLEHVAAALEPFVAREERGVPIWRRFRHASQRANLYYDRLPEPRRTLVFFAGIAIPLSILSVFAPLAFIAASCLLGVTRTRWLIRGGRA